jgi:hypothetical protein
MIPDVDATMDGMDATARWDDVSTPFAHISISANASKLLSRHQNLLEEHRKFLSSLQEHCGDPSEAGLLHQCLEHTNTLAGDVKAIADRLLDARGSVAFASDPNTTTGPKHVPDAPPQATAEPVSKASVSTPADRLSGRARTSTVLRSKRKTFEEERDETAERSLSVEAERSKKKARVDEGPTGQSGIQTYANVSEDTGYVGVGANAEPAADENWFAKEVEERLRQKELNRLKKKQKKRKRDSEGSDVTMADAGQDQGAHLRPQRKKRKGSAQTTEASCSASTAGSGRSTPIPGRAGSKRSSPAAQYIGSILEQDRVKRQKVQAV